MHRPNFQLLASEGGRALLPLLAVTASPGAAHRSFKSCWMPSWQSLKSPLLADWIQKNHIYPMPLCSAAALFPRWKIKNWSCLLRLEGKQRHESWNRRPHVLDFGAALQMHVQQWLAPLKRKQTQTEAHSRVKGSKTSNHAAGPFAISHFTSACFWTHRLHWVRSEEKGLTRLHRNYVIFCA